MNLTRRKFIKLLGVSSLASLTGKIAFPQTSQPNLTEVKIAYPPTMAALPLVKGSEDNFYLEGNGESSFTKQNIDIKLIPSKGSSDAARLVGGSRADCCITDLSSALYAIQGTGNLKISSTIFDPNEAERYYGLLRSQIYEIQSLQDLFENWLDKSEKKSIVLSLRGDDHYSTDMLLQVEGFQTEDSLHYLDQEDLILRMTGLLNGNYVSAVIPEPLLTLALDNPEFRGYQASLITDYREVTLPPFVLAFGRKNIAKNPELIQRFYAGWIDAISKTNESNNYQLLGLATKIISETLPSLKRAIDQTEFTEDFADLFDVPTFSNPEKLNEEIYSSVLDWTISKGYLENKPSFDDIFDGSSAILADETK